MSCRTPINYRPVCKTMPCAKNQMPKRLLSILKRFLTQTVFRIHFTHNNDNNAVPFFFYAQILSTLFTLSVSLFLPPSLSVTNSSMINSVQPWMGTHYASIKLMNQTHLFLLLWIVYTSWQPNTNNSFSAQNTHTHRHTWIHHCTHATQKWSKWWM